MNNEKAEFVFKLGSVVLFLGVLYVVWLLAKESNRPQTKVRRPVPAESRQTVVARQGTSTAATAKAREDPPERRKQPGAPRAAPKSVSAPLRIPTQVVPPVTEKPSEAAPGSERTVRLADGREVTFGGLTFGLEHKYVHDKPAAKPAPNGHPRKEGTGRGMRTISIKTTSPSLVAWLHCRAAQGSFLEADFISIVDEGGVEGALSNPSSIFNPAEFETVGAWQISNFPRRDAKMGIRFYSRDSSHKYHRLAEFWAPNPAPQKHPVWSAEQLPIAKTVRNVEYRLINFRPASRLFNELAVGPMPPNEWTTAVFKVLATNQPAARWKIESVTLSDATGNLFVPERRHFSTISEYLVFSFDRTFWSSETAGRIRTEFARTSGFSSNELVTLANVQVPSQTNLVTIGTRKTVGNVAFHVEGLRRHTPPVRMGAGHWNLELTAALVPDTAETHVSIAQVTDQTGQQIAPGITHKLTDGRQSFLFHTAPQSATLNITFAVQNSQVVEFVAALRNGFPNQPLFSPAAASANRSPAPPSPVVR